jgi:hypothetical protein
MWSAGEGDDKQRFLADLRALRDRAALEFDELAARAHYPSNVLKEAANGPTLPTLPILAAYVRACEGDVPEWEERWRRLGFDSRADAGLPVRPAGASPAAVAGARAGVSVVPPDAYDPDRIRAALRGSHGGSARGGGVPVRDAPAPSAAPSSSSSSSSAPSAASASVEPVPEGPASWSGRTSWDETTPWDASTAAATGWGSGFQSDPGERWDGAATSPPGNGNHHASQPVDTPSSATIIEAPDAARADAIRHDPFSAAWLQDGELTSPPDTESEWPEQAETALPETALPGAAVPETAAPETTLPEGALPEGAEESWFTPRETAGSSPAKTEPPSAAEETWFTPHGRAGADPATAATERDLVPPTEDLDEPIVTGFWTPSAAASAPAPSAPAPSAPAPAPAPSAPARAEPAEVQRSAAPSAEDYAVPPASWTRPAETSPGGPPGAADRTTPMRVQAPVAAAAAAASIAAGPSRTIAGTVPPGPVVPPSKPRSDRLYLMRLLVVIVVAALIGSILVLLVR